MKRMSTIFALAASAILLASCADPQPAGIPAELREIMRAGSEIALPAPHPDFAEIAAGFLTPNLSAETDARVAEVVARQTPPGSLAHVGNLRSIEGSAHLSAFLSHEEIAEEIHFLFDLMRYGYAAYQYFGGDAVFLPLRDSMLECLAEMSEPLRVADYLSHLLAPALRSAISDNHFQIHDITIGALAYVAFMSEEHVVRRDGGAFSLRIDGATYRVLETTLANGARVDGIMPTITRDGEFAFAFGHVAAASDRGAWELVALLEDERTGERHSRVVGLSQLGSYATTSQARLSPARDVGGVTVVASRNLQSGRSFADTRREFFDAGMERRDEPVLIMDLRGNRGGRHEFAQSWVEGYASRPPRHEFVFVQHQLESATTVGMLRALNPAPRIVRAPLFRRFFLPWPREPIPNENLVIVLMDSRTTSAGEVFVGYLRQLENALFVGANTHGNFVCADILRTSLPRSGLSVIFGRHLNLRPDLSQFEGVGFLPDLWVPPGESLERVLAFIERYGLNR